MYSVVGIENVDYTSKKTDKRVTGTKLHLFCEVDESDEDIIGQRVETIYVSDDISINGIDVGDVIDVLYNKFGRVTKIIKK